MNHYMHATIAAFITAIIIIVYCTHAHNAPGFVWTKGNTFEVKLKNSSFDSCIHELLNILKINIKDRCGYAKISISINGNIAIYEDYCCLNYGTILGLILEYHMTEFCSKRIIGTIETKLDHGPIV